MPITSEKTIELAQQYLSRLQRDNEIYFANNKPGAGKDYYDFLDGLGSECDHIEDDHRYGYQNKKVETDLESILNVANIKVDRESKEYNLLIHKFLLAAVDACYERLSMYKGEFDFKLDSTKLVTGKPSIKHQAKTIAIQEEINRLAKEIMDKYPRTSKYDLATEIADKLIEEKKLERAPKFEAIRKNYLNKYPNF
jgi:hypothetical protein